MLDSLDLRGRLVTLDALHTPQATARYLVFERDADYRLSLKDQQKQLQSTSALPPPRPYP